MLLICSGKKGTLFSIYRLDWTPGYRIQRLPHWIWPLALLYRNIKALIRHGLDLIFYKQRLKDSQMEKHKNLSFGVEYVYSGGVEGDIAEFGTLHGFSASSISLAMSEFDKRRRPPWRLFLFDSFQGLPVAESQVDRNCSNIRSGVWGPASWQGLSKEELRRVCARFLPSERMVFYDGWFKDTLPQVPPETRFSMLHIDCDLYQSTVDVLDFCFSNGLLSEGACIFFDDWNDNKATPQLGEREAWFQMVGRYSVLYSDWGTYGWSGKKFLVHSYNRTVFKKALDHPQTRAAERPLIDVGTP